MAKHRGPNWRKRLVAWLNEPVIIVERVYVNGTPHLGLRRPNQWDR